MFNKLSGQNEKDIDVILVKKREELKKLLREMHFGRNICEHSPKTSNACSTPYCFKIHLIEKWSKRIFDPDFPFQDFNSYFFENMRGAREYCATNCSRSLYHFEEAERYVRSLTMALN
jgi:hypothetical protein